MSCCNNFETNKVEVTRSPNPVFRALDTCGDKGQYKALTGAEYKVGTPVKFGDTGAVVPALDGVDAIGLALDEFIAEDGDKVLVQRTGHVYFSVIAEAIGKDATSETDWWAIHKELIKSNIYVEFK